jgi:hypothetical protein
MSYNNPYTGPYGGSNQYLNNPNVGSRHQDTDNFDFNPYARPSHPTYDQSGYGASGPEVYTDEPAYPPQRQPTHRTQINGSGNLPQRKEDYQPGADFTGVSSMKK